MKTDLTNTTQRGHVRKRGNSWYCRIRVLDSMGGWREREFRGGSTKREAEAKLREFRETYLTTGIIIDAKQMTVADLADQWYASEVEPSALSTNSRVDYKNIINNHIKKHTLGTMKLINVTPEKIQSYIDEKYYGTVDESGKVVNAYSDSHVKKHVIVLKRMFTYAVYPMHYLHDNPMQYVKKRKKESHMSLFDDVIEDSKIILSNADFSQIIDFLNQKDSTKCFELPVQIAYFCGLRAGEVCGLTWQDIDLENKRIIVRRSMYYDGENKCWELKTTKNGQYRYVDFGERLKSILINAKCQLQREKSVYGELYQSHFYQERMIKNRHHVQIFTKIHHDISVLSSRCTKGKFFEDLNLKKPYFPVEFVCTKAGGELMTTQSLKWLNKLIKKEVAGQEGFHFHMLRHTYATNLVSNGANIKDVQALLGHSDIGVTMNTYSHPTIDSRKEAVGILEDATKR